MRSRSHTVYLRGHSKPMPGLLLYEKGGHGSLSLYLSSRWSGEMYDLCCQLVWRCSTYTEKPSALTLGLCKVHSEHLPQGVSTFFSHITSVSAHQLFPFGSSPTLAYKNIHEELGKTGMAFLMTNTIHTARVLEAAENQELEQTENSVIVNVSNGIFNKHNEKVVLLWQKDQHEITHSWQASLECNFWVAVLCCI